MHKFALFDVQCNDLGADVRTDANLCFGLDAPGGVDFLHDGFETDRSRLDLQKLFLVTADKYLGRYR